MMARGHHPPRSPQQQRRGYLSSPGHRNQRAARKLSLTTVIRWIYWGMFLLLFIATFLRTSIDTGSGTQNSSVTSPGSTSNHGAPTSNLRQRQTQQSIHATFQERMNLRGPDQNNRRTSKISDDVKPNNSVVPGLHNPSSAKFHQDAGKTVPDEYFFNKTFGKSTSAASGRQNPGNVDNVPLEEIVMQHNQKLYGNKKNNDDQKVDWWSLMQKHERKKAPTVDVRDLGPRSSFVQKLYQMKDDLMLQANGTATANTGALKRPPSIPENWRDSLAKTPPDQPVNFSTPILPPPSRLHFGNSTMIVLVISHQGSFIKRQAIRETWAKHHSSKVLFVVAQSDCTEFERDLGDAAAAPLAARDLIFFDDNGKEETKHNKTVTDKAKPASSTTSNATNSTTSKCDEIDHSFLRLEQEKFQDLLEIPMKEHYSRLPEKLLQAYHWVLKNVPNVEWVVKSDDDMFVRVANLERYLKKYNSDIPMVIGEIIYHSKVSRGGKWAELEYPYEHYPFWPKGSAGHVMSRAAAKYFSDTSESLHRYQGEDTSIGIWLNQAQQNRTLEDVTYINAKNMFESHGKLACTRAKYMIVGHDLRPDELLECYQNYTQNFTESAWLDDPSEFDEMIRQEMGASTATVKDWHPAIGHNFGYKRDTQGVANHVSTTNFGYKGTPVEKN